ncbi:hypothetical protein M9H77_09314 [Catharanthus roseus]|uniref:Uncharacterized protein n=1 Tax=Catharanthus roseus TaxID=4058 RepID=A0ACC0C091_CATRO|nr:hypothetical protein M9H77_09314 [Catharanthus roseus]
MEANCHILATSVDKIIVRIKPLISYNAQLLCIIIIKPLSPALTPTPSARKSDLLAIVFCCSLLLKYFRSSGFLKIPSRMSESIIGRSSLLKPNVQFSISVDQFSRIFWVALFVEAESRDQLWLRRRWRSWMKNPSPRENHNPNKGIPFFKVENQEDVVQIEYEDVLM